MRQLLGVKGNVRRRSLDEIEITPQIEERKISERKGNGRGEDERERRRAEIYGLFERANDWY